MLRKFAAFEVLEATLAPRGQKALARYAHRHHFQYDPRPGYLYVRSRAISSRCNDNYDEFPADEIKKSYASFVGKPVFVNHNNDNHRRMRGVIIDAALHEDRNPDGTPDTWVEVLMEVDAVKFPRLAKAILDGHIDRTSMGTDVAFSVCSVCNNKATTPLEYCAHIPRMKGQRIYRTTASGTREGILVREICHGLAFFENSLLVEEPADPTAFFLGVDDHSGLAATASKVAHQDEDYDVFHPSDPEPDIKPPKYKPGDRVLDGRDGGATIHKVYPSAHPGKSHRVTVKWDDPKKNLTWDGKKDPEGAGDKTAYYEHVFDPHPDAQGSFEDHVNAAIPHDDLDAEMLRGQTRGPSHLSTLDSFLAHEAGGWDCGEGGCNRTDPHIHLSHDAVEEISGAAAAGQMRGEMHDHEQQRTVNLADHNDLHAHMSAGHDYYPDDMMRNSHEQDHPALDEGSDEDRPLRPHEVRRLHDWEHGHGIVNDHPDYDGGTPGHFMGDSHFHTASKTAGGKAQPPSEHPVLGQSSADNIVAKWHEATPDEHEQGRRWYSDAHIVAKAIAANHPHPAATGAGVIAAYSPQNPYPSNLHTAARSLHSGQAIGPGEGALASADRQRVAQRIMGTPKKKYKDAEHHSKVLTSPKISNFAHLIEHGGQDEKDSTKGSSRVVVDRHALSVAVGHRVTDKEFGSSGLSADSAPGKARYEHVADHYREAAKRLSEHHGYEIHPHQVQAVTWMTQQRQNQEMDDNHHDPKERGRARGRVTNFTNAKAKWQAYHQERHPELSGQGLASAYAGRAFDPDGEHFGPMVVEAYGETMAPADVDTLRDEQCPVCGEADAYDGNECKVCGFVAPPKVFQDPDLGMAQRLDLRKGNADSEGTDPNGDGMPDVIPGTDTPGDDMVHPDDNELADPTDAGQDQVDKIVDEQEPLSPDDIAEDGQVEQQPDENLPGDGVAGDLTCPACASTFDAAPPQSTPTDVDVDDSAPDGLVEGDVCPNCGNGLLASNSDMEQLAMEQQDQATVPVATH